MEYIYIWSQRMANIKKPNPNYDEIPRPPFICAERRTSIENRRDDKNQYLIARRTTTNHINTSDKR